VIKDCALKDIWRRATAIESLFDEEKSPLREASPKAV